MLFADNKCTENWIDMKITRFNHAAVNVTGQLANSLHFYQQVLGLPTVPRPESLQSLPGAWIQLPGDSAQLHIIGAQPPWSQEQDAEGDPIGADRIGGDPIGVDRINPFGSHVAYFVADLDQAEAELRELNYQLKVLGEGNRRIIWLLDPVANVVELQQDPEFTI